MCKTAGVCAETGGTRETPHQCARGVEVKAAQRMWIALTWVLISAPVWQAQTQSPSPDRSGNWIATGEAYGTTVYFRIELQQSRSAVTGTIGRQKVQGTVDGTTLHLFATQDNADTTEIKAAGTDRESGSGKELQARTGVLTAGIARPFYRWLRMQAPAAQHRVSAVSDTSPGP